MSESKSEYEYEYVYVMVGVDEQPVKGGVIKTVKPLEGGFDDKGKVEVKEGYGESVDAIFGKMPKDYDKFIEKCEGGTKIDNPDMYCVFLNKGDGTVAALGYGKGDEKSRFVDMYVTDSIDKGIQGEPIRLCYGGEVAPSSASDPAPVIAATPAPAEEENNSIKILQKENDKNATKKLRNDFIEENCKYSFKVYETGGGGDCFYYVVAAAVKPREYNKYKENAMMSIRNETADFVKGKEIFRQNFEALPNIKAHHLQTDSETETKQKKFNANIDDLLKQATYGEDHHMYAVAARYNINIITFAEPKNNEHKQNIQLILTAPEKNPYLLIYNTTDGVEHYQLVSYNDQIKVNYKDLEAINDCFKKTDTNTQPLLEQIKNTNTVYKLLDTSEDANFDFINVARTQLKSKNYNKDEENQVQIVKRKYNESLLSYVKRVEERIQKRKILIEYINKQNDTPDEKINTIGNIDNIDFEEYYLRNFGKPEYDIYNLYIQLKHHTVEGGSRRNRRNDRKQKQNQRTRKRKTSLT